MSSSSRCSDDVGDLENMPLTVTNTNLLVSDEHEKGKAVKKFRITNSLSILFLISSVYSIFYYSSNSERAYNDFFNPKFTHFQIDIIMFLFIWGFIIIISSLNALLRNIFIYETDIEEQKEIVNVLEKQFQNYFALGNCSFSIYVLLNIFRYYEAYAVNLIFGTISLICYSFAYLNYKKASHTNGIVSFIAFNVNVSVLLAWNSCMLVVSIFSFIDNYDKVFKLEYVIYSAYICHITLCAVTLILITYFNDVFFGAIVLLFQTGIVLRSKNFTSNESKLNLILCLFNALCVVYILLLEKKQLQMNLIDEDEIKTFCKSYKKNNDNK